MTIRSLNPEAEPIFALLVTDPEFSQTANEFLQPLSFGDRHEVYEEALFMNHPENCAGCGPHRLMFLAKEAAAKPPRKPVAALPAATTITNITPGPGSRRANAKAHGPQPKRRKAQ